MSNIILMNRSYKDDKALETVINYCANPCKSEMHFAYGADDTSAESIINDMKFMKGYLGKEQGK